MKFENTSMIPWKLKCPPHLVLENDAALKVGVYAKQLGITKALLVTDKVMREIGLPEKIINAGKKDNLEFAVYHDVEPEPPVDNPNAALEIYKKNNCNGVIGLGGGSVLDVAKATAMLATNSRKFEDYVGIDKVENRCAPLMLMPTTSGTGSETSSFSIMMVNGSKMGVVDQKLMADIAIVDPKLTITVPRTVTASTGLDTFAHHLDSLFSKGGSRLCDLLCLEGIRIVTRYLRKACADGENLEARYWMSYASTLGGVVMNMTDGAAANHALAFALGAKHVSHGLANAVMLPHVFYKVAKAEHEKVVLMGEAMGENMEGISGHEAVEIVGKALTSLVEDVGCYVSIERFGIDEGDLEFLIEESIGQKRVMGHATYQMTENEIKDVFINALNVDKK
ncbi:MAG: iron-containing alcohol dehydrogenase [Eubacteriales bacterium]